MNSTPSAVDGKSAVIFSRVDHVLDRNPKRCTLAEALELLQSDQLRPAVETIRAKYAAVRQATGSESEARKAVKDMKAALPAFMFTGLFNGRGDTNLVQSSGLVVADFDHLDAEAQVQLRAKLITDPCVMLVYASPSSGVKAVYHAALQQSHAANFAAVRARALVTTGHAIDESGKNAERLCFASWDPNAYCNPDAEALLVPEFPVQELELPHPQKSIALATNNATARTPEETAALELKLKANLLPVPSDDRGVWIATGYSLKRTLGDAGLTQWIEWSKKSVKFVAGECEQVWPTLKLDEREQPATAAGIVRRSREADEAAFTALAKLLPAEYDRVREAEAKKLSIRTSTLDAEVAQRRPETSDSNASGSMVELDDPEPWPQPVDGAEVLDAVAATFANYVALPVGAADALALWTAHAHCFEAFLHSPRLNLFSPEKGCGKTTLLDVVCSLTPRALRTESITPAVLFRLVELHKPILALDEVDTYLADNDELRGLLNAGHKRGARAFRCEGDKNEVRAFNAFAPAVLAGIGHLQGTLHDRSVQIRLVRARPGEVMARFDSRRIARERELNRKLARWAHDNSARLEACDPVMPQDCFNRLADNWRPLMAVAEVAGGPWLDRARTAFALLTSNDDVEAQGQGVLLLRDLQELFVTEAADRLTTATLVERLNLMEDRPWCDERKGHGVNANWLSRKLRPFSVHPRTIRTGVGQGDTAKGYHLEDFTESFGRYLPDTTSPERHTVTTPVNTGENSSVETVTGDEAVTVQNQQEAIANIDLLRCDGSNQIQPDEILL
jgi:putative DNA primase/helicase